MLAKGKRCGQAKVALEIANKGFCSTKSVYYHGVKLHGLAESKFESLPLFQAIAITDAAQHDNKAFKDLLAPLVYGCDIYADKAYCDQTHAKQLLEEQGVTLVAIEKRKKRQKELTLFQEVNNYNTSCVRQPVESLFNWLIEKTNIQNAAKCRATTGLLTHIFAKIAAAALFLNLFNY
jgi:IS5 family transposase